MNIVIIEEPVSALPDYGEVPITFFVKSRYHIKINKKVKEGYYFKRKRFCHHTLKTMIKLKAKTTRAGISSGICLIWGYSPLLKVRKESAVPLLHERRRDFICSKILMMRQRFGIPGFIPIIAA